jgi:hypothetical protein
MKAAIITLTFASLSANATLNPLFPRGEEIEKIKVPDREPPEICVIPRHLKANYSERDLKEEKKLCEMNLYENVAVCPKMNSTNPGLDIHKIPKDYTRKQVVDSNCVIKVAKKRSGKVKNIAKKIAKYKLSTSCSYTPSILSYYHLSRFFGNILNVPPAVLRTVDLKNHLAWGRLALSKAKAGSTIRQTWQGLYSQLSAGSASSKRDLLLTDNADQSYGALLQTASHEEFNKTFFNGGTGNVGRTTNLRDKNPVIASLAKPGPLNVGREFTAANVQKIVQLRDAANMIVMDTLLNQQDRMGNIHSIDRYYYLDAQDRDEAGQPKLKIAEDLEKDDVSKLGAVSVSEVLLKDNDCGVAKDNIDKKVGLDKKIAHIDPNTYSRLLQLNAMMDTPDMKKFFNEELLFTSKDYASVRANLADLVNDLHATCISNRLSLDLDLQAHFTGQKSSAGCELKE